MYGYPACSSRSYGTLNRKDDIAAVIGAVRGLKLDNSFTSQPRSQIEVEGVQANLSSEPKQMEAFQHESAGFEELPTYEQSTGVRQTPTLPSFNPLSAPSVPPMLRRTTTQILLQQVTEFRANLNQAEHQRHWKRDAKRAARDLVRELYDREIERRRMASSGGYLECGERGQVRRDLKPLKHALKEAIWEVRSRRSTRC